MKRSFSCLMLIVLFAGCSSAPRTVLTLETTPLGGDALADSRFDTSGQRLPAHAMLERPNSYSVWVKGEYVALDGRYVWVPGHWRQDAVAR